MMTKQFRRLRGKKAGFSLVELLVVMVIMGLVVSAIMSLYVNMQKTSGSSEEVVEVQQGLRIALNRIALDLRMAGFLIAGDAITAAGPTSLTLRSATSNNTYARIGADLTLAAGETAAEFAIDPPEMALMFNKDEEVRLVDPASGCLLLASTCTDESSPVMTISSSPVSGKIRTTFPALAADVKVLRESMLVRTNIKGGVYPYPNTITYLLNGTDLVRQLNGALVSSDNILVSKISLLNFHYTLDDGTLIDTIPAGDTRLGQIQSVRVVLQATTIDSVNSSGGAKVRSAETTVKLRNR